jgi:hypothetical protein
VCALVAGCGGEERAAAPPLPAALAEGLAARSDSVAERLEAGDGCAARAEAEALQAETIAAVNDRRIPQRYQEELLGSVAALLESIECAPPPPPGDEADDDEDKDDDKEEKEDEDDANGKGKDKGKGKGKGKGKDKKGGGDG